MIATRRDNRDTSRQSRQGKTGPVCPDLSRCRNRSQGRTKREENQSDCRARALFSRGARGENGSLGGASPSASGAPRGCSHPPVASVTSRQSRQPLFAPLSLPPAVARASLFELWSLDCNTSALQQLDGGAIGPRPGAYQDQPRRGVVGGRPEPPASGALAPRCAARSENPRRAAKIEISTGPTTSERSEDTTIY